MNIHVEYYCTNKQKNIPVFGGKRENVNL